MENATEMRVAAVRWPRGEASLGDELAVTVELEGGASAEVELEVDAWYDADAAAGGGFVPVPVARMQVPVAVGQARLEVPWTVALPADAPGVAGIPAFRARARVAGADAAASELLSIGAVEEVAWVPPPGGPPPRNPAVQAEFTPGQALGLHLAGRGLAGFTADFRIFREAGRGGEPRTAVDAIRGVPLDGGTATTSWLPDPARVGSLGTAPFTFEVSLRHPAVAYAVVPQQQKQKAKLACKVCGKPQLEIVVPEKGPAPCDCEPSRDHPLQVKAKAYVEADGMVVPLDYAIQWLRCKPSGKKGVENETPEHDGAEWDYLRQPDDSELIKARINPDVSSMYGYPDIRETLNTTAACLAWRDRHQIAKGLVGQFDLGSPSCDPYHIIKDPVDDLLTLARLLMNEMQLGLDEERRCIAYVVCNRARVNWEGRVATIHDVIFDKKKGQIATAVGKSEIWPRYAEDREGPLKCPECYLYRRTLRLVAEVMADTLAQDEARYHPAGSDHAYYWYGDGEPAVDYDYIIQPRGQDGFRHGIWGSLQYKNVVFK
jgi:hypothetical protein